MPGRRFDLDGDGRSETHVNLYKPQLDFIDRFNGRTAGGPSKSEIGRCGVSLCHSVVEAADVDTLRRAAEAAQNRGLPGLLDVLSDAHDTDAPTEAPPENRDQGTEHRTDDPGGSSDDRGDDSGPSEHRISGPPRPPNSSEGVETDGVDDGGDETGDAAGDGGEDTGAAGDDPNGGGGAVSRFLGLTE